MLAVTHAGRLKPPARTGEVGLRRLNQAAQAAFAATSQGLEAPSVW